MVIASVSLMSLFGACTVDTIDTPAPDGFDEAYAALVKHDTGHRSFSDTGTAAVEAINGDYAAAGGEFDLNRIVEIGKAVNIASSNHPLLDVAELHSNPDYQQFAEAVRARMARPLTSQVLNRLVRLNGDYGLTNIYYHLGVENLFGPDGRDFTGYRAVEDTRLYQSAIVDSAKQGLIPAQ